MSRTIDSILVPTDGSDGARIGARRGIDLAARTGADFHTLSVVNARDVEPALSELGSVDGSDREDLLEEEAEGTVDETAELARSHLSGQIKTAVERGIPSRNITAYADRHDIDLIVMGTHGRSGLQRALLGSVVEKTLRTASVPVVAVPPSADIDEVGGETYDDVLLPTDGSEGAEVAIDWGVTLAEVYDTAVHTVYSVDIGRFESLEAMADIYDALEETGRSALETVRSRAREADLTVTGHIASGPAARAILSYSKEHDVDLIVMGTHGRTGVERYLIGSVTETVVRNAGVPVCCVPMEET
jgi:nucleotide-binding universal stress UspA family protein